MHVIRPTTGTSPIFCVNKRSALLVASCLGWWLGNVYDRFFVHGTHRKPSFSLLKALYLFAPLLCPFSPSSEEKTQQLRQKLEAQPADRVAGPNVADVMALEEDSDAVESMEEV